MRRRVTAVGAVWLAAGCSGLVGANTHVEDAPVVAPPTIAQEVAGQTPWPVKTRYVVDLWLHGFALLEGDSVRGLSAFRRDYRDEVIVAKNSRNITTALDDNADALRRGLHANPRLLAGERLALREQSWQEMGDDIAAFLTADSAGGKHESFLTTWKRSPHPVPATTEMIAALGAVYKTDADREWLKTFALALTDEHSKFYELWWREQQRARRPVLAAVDTQFALRYLKQLRGYLHGIEQPTGEILLSLPLGGLGRSVSQGQHSIAVGFPATADSSIQAVYDYTEQVIGVIAEEAVRESITPEEFRAGVAPTFQGAAQIRGGALLLQRAIPELASGYERHFLSAARLPFSANDGEVELQFVHAFPLRQSIIDAIDKRLDTVIRGAN